MATGHFFKTSSDVGAPALTNVQGSAIELFDWVLNVDDGTHWEKVYEDVPNFVAVYRATTGNRHYLRVADSTLTALLNMYETMSDVDTGTVMCPASPRGNNIRLQKSNNASAKPYVAVGDHRFFNIIGYPSSSYGNISAHMGFGEVASYDELDSYNSILMGMYTGNSVTVYNASELGWARCWPQFNLSRDSNDSYTSGSTRQPTCVSLKSPDGLIESPTGMPWNMTLAGENGYQSAQYGRGECPSLFMANGSPYYFYVPLMMVDCGDVLSTAPKDVTAGAGANPYIRYKIPYIYTTPYAPFTGIGKGDIIEDGNSEFYSGVTGTNGYQSRYPGQSWGFTYFIRKTNDEPDRT